MKTKKNANKFPKFYFSMKLKYISFLYILNSAECNGIINFVPSLKIKKEVHFELTLAKRILFSANCFLYVLQKKTKNKYLLATDNRSYF